MLSVPNAVNVGCRKPEIFGDSVSRYVLGQQPLNGINVLLFQFGVKRIGASWRFVISSFPRMGQVLGVRTPFQVFNRVVELVKVLVVDLGKVIGIRNECQRNKPMNRCVPNWVLRAISKGNGGISSVIQSPLKSPWFASSPRGPKRPRTDLSVFGNFVQLFVALNRGPSFGVHKAKHGFVLGYVNV